MHDFSAAMPAATDRSTGTPEASLADREAAADRQALLSPACPDSKPLRERLRAMAAGLVSAWRTEGMPTAAKTAAGLRSHAETLVQRAHAETKHIGWTMVTIVSEHWRERISRGSSGRRLLLLPDCPLAGQSVNSDVPHAMPKACGTACAISTIWAAARDGGWVVESTSQAVPAIGSLLTGQYDGILGVARLPDLEKAFAMLPAFSLPVAAVPFQDFVAVSAQSPFPNCAAAMKASAIDVEWVLGLLGVAGEGSLPVADYLPLLQEASSMFTPANLEGLAERLGLGNAFGNSTSTDRFADRQRHASVQSGFTPLVATAGMAGEFLARGGKFLRPFITLAAFDAVGADRRLRGLTTAEVINGEAVRESVKAAAVAIEIFHKASLVHDDIEDDDQMRYGQATLHVERGVPSAINAGDYLLGLGYRIVSSLPGIDAETQRELVAILADAHLRLAQGQGAELWWRDAGDKQLSPAESLAIYGLKTSPAFEAAVTIGIRLAGLKPAEAGAIDRYSLHVGTGFQVLNDLKDWCGDLENNRRAAGDVLGGRPTVLWALALARLSSSDAQRLLALAQSVSHHRSPELLTEELIVEAIAEIRRLYTRADVFMQTALILEEQRTLAAAAAATCRFGHLRDVLEFLLDLAVPERAASQFLS